MRVLTRAVLNEALLLGGFYAVVFLGLIAAGAATPLVKQGAPILAVLGFLPEQLLLFSFLALPLAMVTAFLAVIGRMREEGELTALMAAGVGTWNVAKALLPIVLVVAAYLAIGSHFLLPQLSQRLLEGRSQLMRQALSAKVERRTPIWQEDRLLLAANVAEEDRLIGLFGVNIGDNGELTTCYAPEARWVADPAEDESGGTALGMEMRNARLLVREGGGVQNPRYATAFVPAWSARLVPRRANYSGMADSLSTAEIYRRMGTIREHDRYTIRDARNLERAWHLRWMLPVAVFAYWAFACGLGLAAGRGNRMLAICLGMVTVVATVFPAYVLAKEVGGSLRMDAGWWVWPPPIILGIAGAWLMWRNR